MDGDTKEIKGTDIEALIVPHDPRTSIAVLPLGPRVIVEKIKETGVSEGGIVIPEQRLDPRKREITLSRGRVVSVGELKEVKLTIGDIVIYADQTAIQLKVGGITYGDVLYEDDVIAIIGE
jgi:co-chaperonin GroES (HSP10)